MKLLNPIFVVLALVFVIFNVTKLDFNNLFEGDSSIALIGIVSSIIVLVLLSILKKSKDIERKMKL